MFTNWEMVKRALKKKVPAETYRLWIDPLTFVAQKGRYFILACPNAFFRQRVQAKCLDLIRTEINRAARTRSMECVLEIKPPVAVKSESAPREKQRPLPGMPARSAPRPLRPDMTFDTFVVGDSNNFAFQASLGLASQKSNRLPGLFLLSRPGLGKTHLSMAVGHHIITTYPNERVRYVSADDFSNEMVQAFRNNDIEAFKAKYRNRCDVLLIENVQYLTGKQRTQIELALTLDALMNAGKKLIFTSCYLPKDIPRLTPDLRSRLACGLITEIESPDYKTRVRILKNKAGSNGYTLPEEIIRYLAADLADDVRALESGLHGVAARSSLTGAPPSLAMAEKVVRDITDRDKTITPDTVKTLVSRQYNITKNDIVSRSRKKAIVWPRQIAIYLTRQYTTLTLQAIAQTYNRQHATALHAIGAVERAIVKDTAVKGQIEYLCRKLEKGACSARD